MIAVKQSTDPTPWTWSNESDLECPKFSGLSLHSYTESACASSRHDVAGCICLPPTTQRCASSTECKLAAPFLTTSAARYEIDRTTKVIAKRMLGFPQNSFMRPSTSRCGPTDWRIICQGLQQITQQVHVQANRPTNPLSQFAPQDSVVLYQCTLLVLGWSL